MFSIENLPEALFDRHNAPLLTGILRGAEREALRADSEGLLATSAHPRGLGSALTHPQITTDFSEALLEFITPPSHRIDDLFTHLEEVQKFTLQQMPEELLWASSMPCRLGDHDRIPVARYGQSNNGRMKTIYRIGLGLRYGRSMQTIAGVHYNFSLPNAFWAFLQQRENSLESLQDFKNRKYFGLIRNFRRHYWLLLYLFGASPAMCKSFIGDKAHHLETLGDDHTLYAPYSTTLRMGDLGYQSKAQESLYVCYNSQAEYIKSLCSAITTPYPPYDDIGIKDAQGNYQQLNTSLLQIENEFYSAVRPKRTAYPGETALAALEKRGVEYVEVRCLDINPFEPLGITREQICFLDSFLLYCALQESPPTNPEESARILRSQKLVVNQGRKRELELEAPSGEMIQLRAWGNNLMDALQPLAQALDNANHSECHQRALELQREKLLDSEKTPSAQILAILNRDGRSYADFALALSAEHTDALRKTPLSTRTTERMLAMAEKSLAEQNALEARSVEDLDSFLRRYFKQYSYCRGS